MKLTSNAFSHSSQIPQRFTCEGDNVSPALTWTDAPKETKSFALIVHDPDAQKKNGFVHWIAYNIPADTNEIPEGRAATGSMQSMFMEGMNDSGKTGYTGPCPPSGSHRYFFRLYALRKRLELSPGATYSQVLESMQDVIIEEAEIMGTYAKRSQRAA